MTDRSIASWAFGIPKMDDAHLQAIGELIVCWSFLEERVNSAIIISLNISTKQGMGLTLQMRNFRGRLQSLYEFWRQTDRDLAELQLKPIVSEIVRLYAVRNAFAHRPWWSHSETGIHSFKLDPDQLPFHPPDLWTVDRVKEASNAIVDAIELLQGFIEPNAHLVRALPCKPEQPSPEET